MEYSYQLRVWTHPKSGAKRLYVNGGWLARDHKLYIVAKANGDWEASITSEYGPGGLNDLYHLHRAKNPSDLASEIAGKALAERGLDHCTFDSIVAVIAGTGTPVLWQPTAAAISPAEIAAAKERGELVAAGRDAVGGYDDSIARLRRARKLLKEDEAALTRLRGLKIAGRAKFGTKAHMKECEVADSFGAAIGVALTPAEIALLRIQLKGI